MKILIVSPGVYTCGIFDEPLVGRYYILEPAGEGTGEQNRAFHALVQEYFSSGCHSYPAASYEDLRNCIKKSLGAGFEKYIYITSNERGISKGVCKSRSEVPADVAVDADGNDRPPDSGDAPGGGADEKVPRDTRGDGRQRRKGMRGLWTIKSF